MPHLPPGDTGSSDLIVYPINHMREVAAKILVAASNAQQQHDAAWSVIDNYIYGECDPSLHDTMMNSLKPYADRLRASYDWQIHLASALFDAADAIESLDNTAAQSFVPRTRGPF